MDFSFLYEMLETESVSGGELTLQRRVERHMHEAGFEVKHDYACNVLASLNPACPLQVLLTGHIDEIGFRVTEITEKGFLHLNKAGYIRAELMQGKRVTVLGRKRLTGVIGLHLKEGVVQTDIKLKDMYVDCGFRSREEAQEWVRPGDFVTYTYTADKLENNFIVGRGLDDKLGAFTVLQTLIRARELGVKIGVNAATTVGEETSMRGAFFASSGLRPTLAIAVDVIHSSDYPGSDAAYFGSIEPGKGPVLVHTSSSNPVICKALRDTAEAIGLAVQDEVAGGNSGTDADKMTQTAAGIPTAVVSIPLRYMHSPSEVGCLDDVEQTVELLAQFLNRIDEHFDPDPFSLPEV